MQYLLQLTYRDGEGPEEGTPEFDAEMELWHELNEELRAAGSVSPRAASRSTPRRRCAQPDGEVDRHRRPVRRDEGVPLLLLHPRRRRPRRRDRDRGARCRPPSTARSTSTPMGRASTMRVSAPLERAYRDERAAVLATITRRLDGDLGSPRTSSRTRSSRGARVGPPRRAGAAGAWLTTTAWRKALDRLRHERVVAAYAPELVADVNYDEFDFDAPSLDDDQLRDALHLLSPGARPRGADGADAAQRRRADRARDRARVPLHRDAMERRLTRARTRSPTRGSRSGCRRTTCCRSGSRASCGSSTWSSTRVTRRPRRPARRGDPARPPACG